MKRRRCTKCKNEMKGHKKSKCSPSATLILSDGFIYKGPLYEGQPCGRGRLFSVDSNYDGDFRAGKKHGRGLETCTDYQYDGEWLDNRYHGKGRLEKKDGSVYTGEFYKGVANGYGIFEKGRVKYTGQWRMGKYNGNGTLKNSEGIYVGHFVSGKKCGEGTLTETNGNIFSGHWYRDMREGSGIYTTDDSTYTGEWKRDLRHGKGTWTSKTQGVYVGEWKRGLRHNQGTHTYTNSSVYKGGWSRGFKTGHGTHKWPDGSYYKGFWLKDEFHGRGTLHENNGHSYFGEWVHNKREGHFVETLPDGTTSSGPWTNDLRHGTFEQTDASRKLYIWGTQTVFQTERKAKKVVMNALVRKDYSVAICILKHIPRLLTWKLVSSYDITGQTLNLIDKPKLIDWFRTKLWPLYRQGRYLFIETMVAQLPEEYREKCLEGCEELFDCLTLQFVANPWRVRQVSYSETSKTKLLEGLHLGELGRCPAVDPYTRQPMDEKSGTYLSEMPLKTSKQIYKKLMQSVEKEKDLKDLVYNYTLDDLEEFIRNARDANDRDTLKRLLTERDSFIRQTQPDRRSQSDC